MSLNEEQLRFLGSAILNAGNDKFGLKTDGAGSVVIPQGSSFMSEVLKLKQKYIALADADHGTQENIYTASNIAAMKTAGVKHIFTEWNASEKAAYEKDINTPTQELQKHYSPSYIDLVAGLKRAESAGITLVASDPRNKDPDAYGQSPRTKILALAQTQQILSDMLKQLQGKTDPAALNDVSHAIFYGANGDTNRTAFSSVVHQLGQIPADQQLASRVIMLALPPEKRLAGCTPTIADLAAIKTRVEQAYMKTTAAIEAESDAIDPNVAETIKTGASKDRKTILRWALGHFDNDAVTNTPDLDELLGEKNVVVIATVLDTKEMDALLSLLKDPKRRMEEYTMRDLPDYIYMPARTGENGKAMPEKVVSVEEYLGAQQKQIVQRTNGRG